MSTSPALPNRSRSDLEALLAELLGQVAELKALVAAPRDEIARLKSLKGRSSIKRDGEEHRAAPRRQWQAAAPRQGGTAGQGGDGEVLRSVHPPGSQFKGFESYDVQDLQISARAVHDRRERWLTPDGVVIVAPLPGGIRSISVPNCAALCRYGDHQGQVTVERLVTLLQAVGVSISKRQVMRLLIDQQNDFLSETTEILRAGLSTADCIPVGDTGASHRGANAVCTQIGSGDFAWFGTTGSKSRLNFLDLLRAGHTDYVINDAAPDYMRDHGLAGSLIGTLAAPEPRQFADGNAWTARLEQLGLAAHAPLRADVLGGDLRLFYLLWLSAVEADVFEPDGSLRRLFPH